MAKETFLTLTAKTLPKLLPLLKNLSKRTKDIEADFRKLDRASATLQRTQKRLQDRTEKLNEKLAKTQERLLEQVASAAKANKKFEDGSVAIDNAASKLNKYQAALDGVRKTEKRYQDQRFKVTTNYGGVRTGTFRRQTGGEGFTVRYKDPLMRPEIAAKVAAQKERLAKAAEKANKKAAESAKAYEKIKDELRQARLEIEKAKFEQRAAEVEKRLKNIAYVLRTIGGSIGRTLLRPLKMLMSIPRSFFRFFQTQGSRLISFFTYDLVNAIGRVVRSIPSALIQNAKLAGDRQETLEFLTLQTRDPAGALKLMDKLNQTAAKTPFTIGQTRQNFAKILQVMNASGMDMGTDYQNVFDILRNFGNAAGGNQFRMNRVVTTMAQMIPRNKANEMDFRELANSLVDLKPILRKMMGLGKGDKFEPSQVNTAMMLEAFRLYTTGSGPMSGMMARQMKTWNGITSNLQDIITIFRETLGRPFVATFGPMLGKLNKFLSTDRMKQGIFGLGRDITKSIQTILRIFGLEDLTEKGALDTFKSIGKNLRLGALYLEDIVRFILGKPSALQRETGQSLQQMLSNFLVKLQRAVMYGIMYAFSRISFSVLDGFSIDNKSKLSKGFGKFVNEGGDLRIVKPMTAMEKLQSYATGTTVTQGGMLGVGSGATIAARGLATGNVPATVLGLGLSLLGLGTSYLGHRKILNTAASPLATGPSGIASDLLGSLQKDKKRFQVLTALEKFRALNKYKSFKSFRTKDGVFDTTGAEEVVKFFERLNNKKFIKKLNDQMKLQEQKMNDPFFQNLLKNNPAIDRKGVFIDQRNTIITSQPVEQISNLLKSEILKLSSVDGSF